MRSFAAAVRVSISNRFAYPGELLLGQVFVVVVFVVFVSLWPVVYGDRAAIDGFSLGQLLTYLVITEAVIMGAPRIWRQVQTDVLSGDVVVHLARPVDYVAYNLAVFSGEALVRVPLVLAVGSAVVLSKIGFLTLSLPGLALGAVSLALALLITFLLEMMVGLGAFWTEDATGWFIILTSLRLLAGGVMVPLEMMPAFLTRILVWTPFPYIAYGPARITVNPNPDTVAMVFVGQLAWVLVLLTAVRVTSRLALGRTHSHGG